MCGGGHLSFGEVLRNRPSLWIYAALTAGVLLISDAKAPALLPFTLPSDPTSFAEVDRLIGEIERLAANPNALWGWAGSVTAFLIILWLITALNQAALIIATSQTVKHQATSLWQGWRAAAGRLTALIVTDTLVYLPLFLLILAIVGGLMGVLLSFIYLSPTGQPSAELNSGVVVSVLCLIPLFLSLPLVFLLTALVRAIAIRFVLVDQLPGRPAVSAVRPFIRQHLGSIGAVTVGSLAIFAFASLALQAVDQLSGLPETPLQLFFSFVLLTGRVGLISLLWTTTIITLQSTSPS